MVTILRWRLGLPWLTMVILALPACSGPEAPGSLSGLEKPPNILFILIDDLGYNDLGINSGSMGDTPSLNEFAAQGLRYTRHYVDSSCTASRIGILTGSPPPRIGFRPDGMGISPEIITLPEALRDLGYATHHVGKWHAGDAHRGAWPKAQGYDTFYGFISQFRLRGVAEAGKQRNLRPTYINPWLQEDDAPPTPHSGHLEDLLSDRVVSFLESEGSSDKPWFLTYWTYAPHSPIEPGERFSRRYPDTPAGRYRALLAQVDAAIGRVLDTLQRENLAQGTLVIIASDNGGTNRSLNNNLPFSGEKATYTEGGVRTPLMIRWPGKVPSGAVEDRMVSYFDYYPTLVDVAKGELPGGAGRNIFDSASLDVPTALYWEMGNSEAFAWGVLSADGRWRLGKYFVGDAYLHDLAADPGASENVFAANPQVAMQLHSDFVKWRYGQRKLELEYRATNERGGAVLSGDSFQRSPGFGGFSFAIALQPEVSAGAGEVQVVAHQPGHWSLTIAGGNLQLDLGPVSLTTPSPEPGICSTVVVSSNTVRSALYPKRSRVSVELFVNNQKVGAYDNAPPPALATAPYVTPTYVGHDSGYERLFRGALGRPTIINEKLLAADQEDPWIRNGVQRVTDKLCEDFDG